MAASAGEINKKERGTSTWMIPPAAAWQRKSNGAFLSAGLFWPVLVLVFSLFLLLIGVVYSHFVHNSGLWFHVGQGLVVLLALGSVALIIERVLRNLVEPLTHLRFWAMRMRGGNLQARIPESVSGEYAELAGDINALSSSLCDLTRDMSEQVRIQTERSAQKSHSLKLLYDVATTINNSRNVDELLERFLYTIKDLVHARAASVRLLSDGDNLRLVASIGLDDAVLRRERFISIKACECGAAVSEGRLKCQSVEKCTKVIEYPLFDRPALKMIAVPLSYRGKVLGIYNLFVEKDELIEREEFTGLLTSIGQHLGVAIAKSMLEADARRLALMEERTLMSHELHDSLAQTLVSLRFQVRMLDDTLSVSGNFQAQWELQRLSAGLEKANGDLRELLGHFRTPMDERGLMPALLDSGASLEKATGIAVYLQDETGGRMLAPNYEVQVLHIVQEALSNVRKHSQAKNVRILVRAEDNSEWLVLVEDDGKGMVMPQGRSKPGESIGLSIMRERTRHLKGALTIESEVDEGTRIELRFSPQLETRDPDSQLHAEFSLNVRRVS